MYGGVVICESAALEEWDRLLLADRDTGADATLTLQRKLRPEIGQKKEREHLFIGLPSATEESSSDAGLYTGSVRATLR
jgi:hypothetical protein